MSSGNGNIGWRRGRGQSDVRVNEPVEVTPGTDVLVVPVGLEGVLGTETDVGGVDVVEVVEGGGFEVVGGVLVGVVEVGTLEVGVLDVGLVGFVVDETPAMLVSRVLVELDPRSEVLVVSCRFASSICAMDIIWAIKGAPSTFGDATGSSFHSASGDASISEESGSKALLMLSELLSADETSLADSARLLQKRSKSRKASMATLDVQWTKTGN